MESSSKFYKKRGRGYSHRGFSGRFDDGKKTRESDRPPGLRGRAIGLWYANRGRLKREETIKKHGGTIRMSTNQLNNVTEAMEASDINFSPEACSSENLLPSKSHFHSSGSSYWYGPKQNDEELKLPSPITKPTSVAHSKVMKFRQKLPVFQFQSQIIDLIHANQVVVVTGETGCGKTTQIPQYILDDAIARKRLCRIVCTQPRRISAIAVAERVAFERSESCGNGNSCGFQIKLKSSFPRRHSSILYCTTGILIQVLQSDSLLSSISHIVLDEIHERDMHSDFLITVIKGIISKRNDLKVILMSATLNAEVFSAYFGNCPMFHVPGFTFPVTEFFLEETLAMTKYKPTQEMFDLYNKLYSGRYRKHLKMSKVDKNVYIEELESYKNSLKSRYSEELCDIICCMENFSQSKIAYDLIVHIIKHIMTNFSTSSNERGAILVFLPGWDDIKQVNILLTKDKFFQPDRYRIIPLHSMMPTAQQKLIFERPPDGITKIVISTNIAETSITIDDVVYVIDAGKIKLKNFESDKDLHTLLPSWETKANAKQRSGRAGRVQNGYCFRLYSKLQESKLDDFIVPEIVRTPLDQVSLQIKILKLGKIPEFLSQVLDCPTEESVNLTLTKLTALNALDSDENLTSLGFHLAQLPVEPQIGKMLLFGAIFSCIDPVLTIAACLSFKDPFVVPLGKEKEADFERKRFARGIRSDHIMFANVFEDWKNECKQGYAAGQDFCWRHFLSASNLKMIKQMRLQFAQQLYDCGFLVNGDPLFPSSNRFSNKLKLVQAVVCSGLYPNIARVFKRKGHKFPTFDTKFDRKVHLHQKSVNSGACADEFEYEWLCYYEKIKTAQVNLYDTSEVSPYALLFFGGNIRTFVDNDGVSRMSVDEWIKFKVEPRIVDAVKRLRSQLDKLLEIKVKRPQWKWSKAQIAVLDSIIDLML